VLVWVNVADHFLSRPTHQQHKDNAVGVPGARRGVDHRRDPLKICKKGQSMFLPPKMSNSKLLLDNSASFTSSRTKDLCQRRKANYFFEAPDTV